MKNSQPRWGSADITVFALLAVLLCAAVVCVGLLGWQMYLVIRIVGQLLVG